MPSHESEQSLVPSMLDRLMDPKTTSNQWTGPAGFRNMVASIRRDLEQLLNTRQPMIHLAEDLTYLNKSILNYGVPDLNSISVNTPIAEKKFSKQMQSIIETHEPRLTDVSATITDSGSSEDPTLRFEIRARLKIAPEFDLTFDTAFGFASGKTTVREGGR